MKHRKKIAGAIAAVMLVTLLAAAPVMAQMPCIFRGDVTMDGEPYEPGGVVTIKLADGTPVPTVVPVVVTASSEYGAVIPQEGGVPAEGAVLNFYVDGLLAGSSTWQAGQVKTLDLAAETDVAPPDDDPATPPVGNGTDPANTLALVWPWIALGAVVAGAIVFVWRRRARS